MARSQRRLISVVFVVVGLLIALIGCAAEVPVKSRTAVLVDGPSRLDFKGTEHTQNRLIGRFWSPITKDFVAWPEVTSHMPRGGWLMVGEQHDHPDHHQVETYLSYFLASQGILGYTIMEMVSADQQYAINNAYGAVDNLKPSDIDWPDKGWPWPRYEQQVKAAMEFSKGLQAGDLSAAQKESIRAAGGAIAHYSTEHSQYLAELIETSHCGMFSAEQAMPMVNMQIARDQVMAQQMTAYALADKVGLFIAGAGHVRADYGVPLWVAEDIPVRTLLLIGVGESENPEDYLPDTFNEQPAAQLVFFVPGIKQINYCSLFGA